MRRGCGCLQQSEFGCRGKCWSRWRVISVPCSALIFIKLIPVAGPVCVALTLGSWLLSGFCGVRFEPMMDGREVVSQGGLIRRARGVSRAACRMVVDWWWSGRWWRGLCLLCFSGYSGRAGNLFFSVMGLEPTTDDWEVESRARLVRRVRGVSRVGCRAIDDRREFGW